MSNPTPAESLILRGLHILMRGSFSPNSPEAQQRHFVQLQQDIGPWFKDYVTVQSGGDPDTDAKAPGGVQ